MRNGKKATFLPADSTLPCEHQKREGARLISQRRKSLPQIVKKSLQLESLG